MPISDTVYLEVAPWGAERYRKVNVPPMDCIYVKDLPMAKKPQKWTDEEKMAVEKHFALNQARQRMEAL